MLKYFRLPFAVSGDKTAVPDASQPSGSVSYEDGFGVDYELDPGVDPAAKDVPRDETNQLFFDITTAIAELQAYGTPDFITPALNGGVAFSYSKYARVKYTNGFVYVSKINANTDLPTVAASWLKLTENANFLTIDDAVFEASVTNGEAVYWDNTNNRFDEAVADNTVKQNVIGFADVTNARVFVAGLYEGQLAGLTPGAQYFLSAVTPGSISTISDVNSVLVGTAKSATAMFVSPIVQRANGNYAGFKNVVGTEALVAADCGKAIQLADATLTLTLPPTAGIPDGARLDIFSTGTGFTKTIQAAGADTLTAWGTALGTFTIKDTGNLVFVKRSTEWRLIDGTLSLKYASNFGSSLAANGYQKLPSGLILQWGTVAAVPSGGSAIVFPIAFPNAVTSINATVRRADLTVGPDADPFVGSISTAGFSIRGFDAGGSTFAALGDTYWFAIGY